MLKRIYLIMILALVAGASSAALIALDKRVTTSAVIQNNHLETVEVTAGDWYKEGYFSDSADKKKITLPPKARKIIRMKTPFEGTFTIRVEYPDGRAEFENFGYVSMGMGGRFGVIINNDGIEKLDISRY